MNRQVLCFLAAVLLAVGSVGICFAERPGRAHRSQRAPAEKAPKRTAEMRMQKLRKVLALDEATAARFYPMLESYDRKRAEIRKDLALSAKELKAALKKRSEYGMRDVLATLEEKTKALHDLWTEETGQLKRMLNTEQQAKYVLFRAAWMKEMRRRASEAREEVFDRDEGLWSGEDRDVP